MKTIYGTILIAIALVAFGCTQKVNDPADVQAIKDINTAWDKAWNDGNAEALASIYTPDAISMGPNQPATVSKDAIRTSFQKSLDPYTSESRSVVEDVRVSGDLAVARGTYEGKSSLKAGGYSVQEKGKWVSAYQRQPDGSWKDFWDIVNSDLPVADALPLGQEELALLQIERDMAEALVKKDAAAWDKMLANEFQANYASVVGNKKQLLAAVKSDTTKFESMINSEMKALVFGDTAIVHGLSTSKSSMGGKDTSGQERFTEVFVKRDGRWQCVTGYSKKIG